MLQGLKGSKRDDRAGCAAKLLDDPAQPERPALAKALQPHGKPPHFDVVPGGRQLKGAMPAALDEAVRTLAAALVPPPEKYPLPFFRVKP